MPEKLNESEEEAKFLKEELLDVAKLDTQKCTGTVALATYTGEKEDTPRYRSLNISEHIAQTFSEMAIRFVKGYTESEDLKLSKFSGDFRPAHQEVEVLDVQDSLLESAVKQIPAPIDIDLLDAEQDDQFINDIRFYVFITECQGERLVFFRRYHRNKELKRSKNIFVRLVGDQFVLLESPTFQFDEKFDAVLYHMHLFSFNKANFQYIFNYYDRLRETVEGQLDEVKEVVPIINFDEFKESCLGHVAKLEKLRNIAGKPYWSEITMADIKRTITEFDLKIEVKKHKGQEMLVYDSANQWGILNLLDDAYLVSYMTRYKYEVTSKQVWKKPPPPEKRPQEPVAVAEES